VALAPDLPLLRSNLGHALKSAGQPGPALAQLQQALALEPANLALHSAVLFLQQYADPAADRPLAADTALAQRLADARRFGAEAARQARPFTDWPHTRQPGPGRPAGLRVGLLSADLRSHPVGFFLESVLAALASQSAGRIELHAYANQRSDDTLSQRLRAHCKAWRAVADLDDATLADTIRADGIDVLIDLGGHTHQNRLPVLAWRPAPVQVSWLGYCASTGLAEVDALIVDPWIAPPGAEAAFAEPLLRLPETFLCFTPPPVDVPVTPLPALAGGAVCFACFNHLAKLDDTVLALWSRLLHTLPGSSLALQSAPLQDAAVRQQVLDRFARHGIGAQRLRLQPAQTRADYLAAYAQVDIALDPFPYPGGTTSLESLWMGVPVLTLPGDTALSRQGLSILQNLGLADWVARDADDYVARAVRHAGDLATLSALRQGLRARLLASPLCDAPRFARHLEAGLRGLLQRR
jgi:predicted O-linked N-acetylglucosamine transferase (SPINDLY family)